MLENFVKINQLPSLVKQQLDNLFRYFFVVREASFTENDFSFHPTTTDLLNFFKKIRSCPLPGTLLFVYFKKRSDISTFSPPYFY